MKFKCGDKVRVKNDEAHSGKVIYQTGTRVLWKCNKCQKVSDDLARSLEMVKA